MSSRSFLDAGWPVDLLAADGLAPLHWALVRGDTAILTLLLDRGSSIDVRSAEGATPLMSAVEKRDGGKVAFLLDRGADPNAADQRGFTALHRAAEMGELRISNIWWITGRFRTPRREGIPRYRWREGSTRKNL